MKKACPLIHLLNMVLYCCIYGSKINANYFERCFEYINICFSMQVLNSLSKYMNKKPLLRFFF